MFKYTPPAKDFFAENRATFAAQMRLGTIAIFHANELVTDNADSHYRFTQNSNMWYLSGLDQEETLLLLFPDAPKAEWREMLFIRETNASIQRWEGWKYSMEEAQAASGVATVKYYDAFTQTLRSLMSQCDGVYLDINEHERNGLATVSPAHRLGYKLRAEFPAHQLYRAAPILERQRSFKQPAELALLQTAIDITEAAFRRVLGFVKPGVWEFEVEAEIQHEFLRRRATGPAYGSIIASGQNACVLHYTQNCCQCQDGELLLMDFGAEYALYSADLTRTIPVNGRFTPRQRAVYDAVLRVQAHATQMLVPGKTLEQYHLAVGEAMTEELLGLSLLSQDDLRTQTPDKPAYKKYFPHGTSHYLGLDTHDLGSRYVPFEAGMVFTCEPGIYIDEEGIGIRLENNIRITEDAPVDLMARIPRTPDEIEALMLG